MRLFGTGALQDAVYLVASFARVTRKLAGKVLRKSPGLSHLSLHPMSQ